MATLQPEKSVPDSVEEERASTPLSLTCKEDYANATNCLSEGRTNKVDAGVEADSLVRWVCISRPRSRCGKTVTNKTAPTLLCKLYISAPR